jgi:hypothetical protein
MWYNLNVIKGNTPKKEKEFDTMTTNKTDKLTKKQGFTALMNSDVALSDERIMKILQNEIALLEKKNSAERKPDPKKVAHTQELTAEVLAVLPDTGDRMTISEMQKASAVLMPESNQQISYILRELEKAGSVVKTVEKRKNYYSKVV